ncbi:uncharacterized protein LOC136039286 isoform X4 [Artemia franciscana]|uniref:uncharacterized protein LOC136039286 isoform X4 n=1 Tax=Artemia franciscana TaxID=6661 RepID=UPI0032DB8975
MDMGCTRWLFCLLVLFIAPTFGRKREAEAVIEDVNAKQLAKLINEKDYVAVYWYSRNCRQCEKVLTELEKIDDDTDHFGVDFVKINDKRLAKQYGIKSFPALTYFRDNQPVLYEGDLMDEETILEFLTSLDAMALPDRIEEVNAKILSKIVEENEFLAVLFCVDYRKCKQDETHRRQCKQSARALQELENIDDEADQLGIGFVKIFDEALAEEYNLPGVPTLVYYRHKIPIIYEGDLTNEEEVLEWLVSNKSTGEDEDRIEDVTAKALEAMITSVEHLAVLFYNAEEKDSKAVLEELENIDDDLDAKGMHFVKIDDDEMAKEYGIDDTPALLYFEKRIPSIYEGNLMEEEEVLAWLIHQQTADEIEEINDEILDKLIRESKHLAVLFYDDDDSDSMAALKELENIDDECDKNGVVFVKIDNAEEAKEYGIDDIPALVYFENNIPNLYQGDLMNEERVLEWLLHQVASDEIEDVTDEMLDKLIAQSPHLAVLFYDKDQKKSVKVLTELEHIDDECDQHGISFVKIDNDAEAIEYGIEKLPQLVYFENGVPYVYEGDLLDEAEVLKWLIHQSEADEIEDVTDKMLDKLIQVKEFLAVLFYNSNEESHIKVVEELENIDDECDNQGIAFVRIDDLDEAKEYGLDELPALVYFENTIPSIYEGDLHNEQEVLHALLEEKKAHENGDLTNEEEVLDWLLHQRNSDTIEEVTDELLDDIIEKHEYVVVYFSGPCKEGQKCDSILDDLENIDDETDDHGIQFVTTEDTGLAKKFKIYKFPSLVFFRNGEPLQYTGDLQDEEQLLEWILSDSNLELPDQIEEVNAKMLAKKIESSPNLVVYFYEEKEADDEAILKELEDIDDECDSFGIDFVKISDDGIEKEFNIKELPALVYFKKEESTQYQGDLMDEQMVLKWIVATKEASNDVIEAVDSKTLENMIADEDFLAVYFYDSRCGEKCEAILQELENIDDDAEHVGVGFVKSTAVNIAQKHGVKQLPAVVFFEQGTPTIYDGDPSEEQRVLDWIFENRNEQSIVNISRTTLNDLVTERDYIAVIFYTEEEDESQRVLRRLELIDQDVLEYDIEIFKIQDHLIAKKYGFRTTPGLILFKKGRPEKYDGDLDDEEEVLDWLTDPDTLELADSIERVNRKMFEKIMSRSDSLVAFFYNDVDCKQCDKVLEELENIDDEARAAGIDFVKLDDKELARDVGVFALPAVVFFKPGQSDPVIYAGDLKSEERLLDWMIIQKDPTLDQIEEIEGQELIDFIRKKEFISVFFYNEEDCEKCTEVLEGLENIDDDTDRHGIQMLKTKDTAIAKNYGVMDFPALIYFENQVPSIFEGDLMAEEEVLQWLVLQKTEDRIELVTRGILESLLNDVQYLAVFFYKQNCKSCEQVLQELENIDDECDRYGIQMVKIMDTQLAKRYGIKTFPALVYFRNGNPLLYDGDLRNEDSVFEWLQDDDNRELADEIEEVNARMLDRLIDDSPFLAVFFYDDECAECPAIIQELENIDDEADAFGIDFVKLNDEEAAKKYNVLNTPSLAYFRKKIPLIYEGDLLDENRVLTWLTSQDVFEIKDEIEEVNRKMLDKLLDENDFVAVYFYDNNCQRCVEALQELENIDDEADNLDITFVKIKDPRYAKKYGVSKLPALVYFRKKFPSIYRGDLLNETEVLDWLQKNRFRHPELNVFMYALGAITFGFIVYTVFLIFFFKSPHPKTA